MNAKPRVFKAAGAWLWTCDHDGGVGDVLHASDWAGGWAAAYVLAAKHFATFHGADEGEDA